MKYFNYTLIAIIFFFLVIGVYFLRQDKALDQKDKKDKPIFTIGLVLPLTGDYAAFGEEFKRGAELAKKELEEKGNTLNLIIEDTRLDNVKAVSAVQKMVNIDKVDVVVVSTYQETIATHTISDEKNIPTLVMWDSNQELNDMGDKVFSTGVWTMASSDVAAEYAFSNFGKKAAIFGDQQQWSAKVSKRFGEKFTELGGTIVHAENLIPGEKDYRSVIEKIISKNPDSIYLTVDGFPVAVKQLKMRGYTGKILTSDILDQSLISMDPDIYENVYGTQVADPSGKNYQSYEKSYKDLYKEEVKKPMIGAWAYDSVNLLFTAHKKDGVFLKNIYDINHSGATGDIKFSSEGSSKTFPKMFVVRNSKIILAD